MRLGSMICGRGFMRNHKPPELEEFFIHESFGKGFYLEVDKEHWASLKTMRDKIIALRNCQELFETLVESVTEFEKFMLLHILEYDIGYLNHDEKNFVFRKLRVGLNLRLLTILTAARAYIEQVPQLIGRGFQKSSKYQMAFSDNLSDVFDCSFEYRIMDALRNVAQHANLPLGGFEVNSRNISASGSLVSGEPSRSRTTIEPYFYVSKILVSKKIRKATKDELEALGLERLDAKYCVRKYLSDIAVCHSRLLDDLSEEFENARQALAGARKLLADEKGGAVEVVGIVRRANKQDIDDLYIDGDFYSGKIESNRNTKRLHYQTRSFVSSEVTFRKDTYSGDDKDLWRSD